MFKSVFVSVLYLIGSVSLVWADGPIVPAGNAPAGAPPQPGIGSMLIPFAAMFGVVYFLMIRPQQKKMKEQQSMLSNIKAGDEIVTASGILGKVAGLDEKVVTVEVATNVRVKMLKSQISQVVKGPIKDLA